MAIKVTTLAVLFLVLVAAIQLPKANADHIDCLEACKEQCLEINSDPFSCRITCNNLCDPTLAAGNGRRSLLRGGHFVDRIRGHADLDWIKT